MTGTGLEIKGIKQGIQNQYSDSISLSDEKASSESGWKELLSIVKNRPPEYNHINQATKEKFFNSNTHIIENPLEPSASFQYRVCNSCGKPLALNAIMEHLEDHCKGGGESSSVTHPKEMTDEDTESTASPRKHKENRDNKRPLTEEDSPSSEQDKKRFKEGSFTPQATPLKKQRKVKQRNPTEKHLIDFDKQCGVQLPEGGYCARSLTCKSHSMGAKRSVHGRTQPFDTLLAEYHKQHQTKIGAAAEKRAKQQEIQKHQKQIQKEHRKQSQQQKPSQRGKNKSNASAAGTGGNAKSGTSSGSGKHAGNDVNSNSSMSLSPEEETTQVLNGVSRSFPLPLETNVLSSVKRRSKYFRMREMFASAFSVKPGYTSPGYGAIHSRVGCVDLDRTTDYKFRIRTPQPINQMAPQGMTPQQLYKVQQNKIMQAQMMSMQNGSTNVHPPQEAEKRQQQMQAQSKVQQQYENHGATPQVVNNVQRTVPNQNAQSKGLTPQEIQLQHQKLRQQQLQQQRFEAAAFHLANATKLMQNSNGEAQESPTNYGTNSSSAANTPTSNQSIGSSVGGRLNVGVKNSMNGYGGRVN
ncbi:SGF73 (YGL066W) [Zygosaccharomyces parabailii]|nr:SGF73 (YGL066W) [Zygosaccharomyces parabailii]